MILRDDQLELLHRARLSLQQHKRILLVASTGVGKTVLAMEMIRGAIAKGRRVLFLCHRRELVRQSSRAFWKSNVPHGLIMAGKAQTANVLANVGVINTVANRMSGLREPDLIIIDEAHRSVSPSYLALLEQWPNAHVVGLTATPERTDGRGMDIAGYTDIVQARPMRWYIDAGILSEYEIIAPKSSIDLSGVAVRGGDYATDQLESAIDKPTITGEAVAAYKQFAAGKRCMVFCVTIAHSEHTCEQYNAQGIPAEHIDGTHSDDEITAALARFRSGETLILCTVQLAIEGLDIPAIEVVQFLRPTQSVIVYLQAIGRGLRIEPGKERLIILDQVANWQRHGLPDDAREWSLTGREKRGRKKQTDEQVNASQCKSCYAVFRAGTTSCPRCGEPVAGAGREAPQVITGELERIDIDALRREHKRMQGSARTIADMVAVGLRRGMRRPAEWAANVIAAREGRRPNSHDFNAARMALNALRGEHA